MPSREHQRILVEMPAQSASPPTIVTLPSSATIDQVVEVLCRDGGVIVADMLEQDVLDRFNADLEPFLSRVPFGEASFTGAKTRRCAALFAKSMATADLLMQTHFLGACERILADDYSYPTTTGKTTVKTTLQVSVTQAIQIWPGQGAQPLHRDDYLHHRYHPGPDSQVQVLYAATDFTAQNGATLVVPGSHLWDDARTPSLDEAVPAVMRRGSGLIYLGSTYHGGGQNRTTDELRTAIIISLARGYLRQEENQYLVVPHDIVRRYPRRVQQLLGYALSPPFCGWIEMCDPSVALTETDISVLGARDLLT
jgi:ectoine hydroxylase-related dioxygenase (phytanoyl-CoA dioxygenase family)